jgi:hypothetical protein
MQTQIEDTKIVVAGCPFPDGSGDFSFIRKLIDLLVLMGFRKSNINLVVGIRGCDNLGIEGLQAINSASDAQSTNDYAQALCDIYMEVLGTSDKTICSTGTIDGVWGRAGRKVTTAQLDEIKKKGFAPKDNCFEIGVRNIVQFFLQHDDVQDMRVFVRNRGYVENMFTPQEFGKYDIDVAKEPYVVLSFLVEPNKHVADAGILGRTIKLHEGGYWDRDDEVYSAGIDIDFIYNYYRKHGFVPDIKKRFALGINIAPPVPESEKEKHVASIKNKLTI